VGIDKCKLVELPVVAHPLGNLASAEIERDIPFPIARAYFVHDIPAGAARGGHAHRELEQVLFCLHGGLRMSVDDGAERREFNLDRPEIGLYLPPMTWRDIDRFEEGTVYLVLASAPYDERDYIRDRGVFEAAVRPPP
jgi:hypothetical protein